VRWGGIRREQHWRWLWKARSGFRVLGIEEGKKRWGFIRRVRGGGCICIKFLPYAGLISVVVAL